MAQIVDFLDILAKPARVTTIVHDEITAIRDQFGDARRSEIVAQGVDLSMEDLIAPQDMVVTLSHGGYMKAQAGRRIPGAEARRPRPAGDGDQGRRLHRSPVHRQHARLHPVLFQSRPRLLAQGLQRAAGHARRARQADRQPAAAAGERADHRDPAGQGIHRHPVRVHGDRDGHGQEDAAVRILATAHVGHHRRRPVRRRFADRRRADRRHARRDAVLLRRQGGALRRERRAADGPQRARRARHDARPRRSA